MSKIKEIISIYIGKKYYSNVSPYHPDTKYPEYSFNEISKIENPAYFSIREALKLQKFDFKNFGKKDWNPFKEIIKEGDRVLIKPNLVYHKSRKDPNLYATITHPSVIRAAIDYVQIALKGTGEIIIGDAPIQSADFSFYRSKYNLQNILNFVKKNSNVKISLLDFRKVIVAKRTKIGIHEKKIVEGNSTDYSIINLGNNSKLTELDFNKFRVFNYNKDEMMKYHNRNDHKYLVSNIALNADVILNLPKLKVHKKAGITCCLKNMVGIIGSKDCLPHYSIGSSDENGDEYKNKSLRKKINSRLCDKQGKSSSRIKLMIIASLRLLLKITSYIIPYKDNYTHGSWWGNNTIPRTVVDINKIILYCDKNGKMQPVQQRKIFNIIDAIIAGEKEGPLNPNPKEIGYIITGRNSVATDIVCSILIGYNSIKIPLLELAKENDKMSLFDNNTQIEIILPEKKISLNEFKNEKNFKFKPPTSWKNYIER